MEAARFSPVEEGLCVTVCTLSAGAKNTVVLKWGQWVGSNLYNFTKTLRVLVINSHKQMKICFQGQCKPNKELDKWRENLPCCNGGQLKWEKPTDASVPGMGGAAQWLDTQVHPSRSLLDLHAARFLQTISHSPVCGWLWEQESMNACKWLRCPEQQSTSRMSQEHEWVASNIIIYDVLHKVLLITFKSNHSSVKNASGKYQDMLNK